MFDPFHTTRLRRRQDQPGHSTREGTRDLGYEQPLPRSRSLLDGGPSRRNLVLRYPTREYEPDHASRTRQACRPLSRATTADRRKPRRHPLTNVPPYEPKPAVPLILLVRRRSGSHDRAPESSASTRLLAEDLLAAGWTDARFPREGGRSSAPIRCTACKQCRSATRDAGCQMPLLNLSTVRALDRGCLFARKEKSALTAPRVLTRS
jgi:hypothetical protein